MRKMLYTATAPGDIGSGNWIYLTQSARSSIIIIIITITNDPSSAISESELHIVFPEPLHTEC